MNRLFVRYRGLMRFTLVAALLFASAVAMQVGCQERVVRQRSYYRGQFSHVTEATPPTAVGPEREQTDFLQDAWRGLGNLFRSEPKPMRNTLTAEELRDAQRQRAENDD